MHTLEDAKVNLSQLVKMANMGEQIILTNGEKPVAMIVPFNGTPLRTAGTMKGRWSWTDDAFAPLTDQEMKDLGFE